MRNQSLQYAIFCLPLGRARGTLGYTQIRPKLAVQLVQVLLFCLFGYSLHSKKGERTLGNCWTHLVLILLILSTDESCLSRSPDSELEPLAKG